MMEMHPTRVVVKIISPSYYASVLAGALPIGG